MRAEIAGADVAEDGWVSVQLTDELRLHVRLRRNDAGQVVVTDLYVWGSEITTDVLRHLYPARLLAAMRQTRVDVVGDNDEDLGHFVGSQLLELITYGSGPFSDKDVTLPELRARAQRHLNPAARTPLGRPDGNGPAGAQNAFYAEVAKSYRSAASESGKPAVLLAEENDVPVETVRRWIKEARRRGHLPPGRRGRAE